MISKITPVILCGGAGTRLWPLSTPAKPKQLLKLGAEQTMLQETVARVSNRDKFAAPIFVAGEAQVDAIEAQLREANCEPGTLILEPCARNTAPAIALAALAAPEALLLIMSSDHVIGDVAALHKAIESALPVAKDGWLVAFGITPDHPETGFGYIKLGDALVDGVHRVDRFVEKPGRTAAERMLLDGGYVWNGGIFLFRAQSFLDALQTHAPTMLASVRQAIEGADVSGVRLTPERERFEQTAADSIDFAVMEKAERVAVAPVSMGWSDVGSWDAVHALGPIDDQGNTVGGKVVELETSNCLFRSEGPTIAALGVSDLIVVATADHVLILPRGRSQDVKKLLDAAR